MAHNVGTISLIYFLHVFQPSLLTDPLQINTKPIGWEAWTGSHINMGSGHDKQEYQWHVWTRFGFRGESVLLFQVFFMQNFLTRISFWTLKMSLHAQRWYNINNLSIHKGWIILVLYPYLGRLHQQRSFSSFTLMIISIITLRPHSPPLMIVFIIFPGGTRNNGVYIFYFLKTSKVTRFDHLITLVSLSLAFSTDLYHIISESSFLTPPLMIEKMMDGPLPL